MGPLQPKEIKAWSKLSCFWGPYIGFWALEDLTQSFSGPGDNTKRIPDPSHTPTSRLCQSPRAQPDPANKIMSPLSELPHTISSNCPRASPDLGRNRGHFRGSGGLGSSSMSNLTGPPWLCQASQKRPGPGSEVRVHVQGPLPLQASDLGRGLALTLIGWQNSATRKSAQTRHRIPCPSLNPQTPLALFPGVGKEKSGELASLSTQHPRHC